MVNWSQIDTVLLDMDGTLLDLHFDNFFWMQHVPTVYGEKNNIEKSEAFADLHARFESQRGKMQWYCLDFWSDQLNLNIAELKQDMAHKIQMRPWAEEFLKALKLSGKKVFLLTNAHRDSLDLKMEKIRIEHYFDALISTHDYGYPKEEQALWKALQADYPFDLERTLLVDDTEAVLASAQRFGICHLLALRQPDSQSPPRMNLSFNAIHHFNEVLPIG
ncbi:MAG: GMP/IMP nucleotidase [Sinobacterium sp.]|nr:GMP/IMP nucleotidase [Sinobacterium sp.]